MLINDIDRKWIENKYHKTDEPFDAYTRMCYHGWDCDSATGLSDEEIDAGLAELSEKVREMSHPEQKALLECYVLDHTRIDANSHDWFITMYTWDRPVDPFTLNKWHVEALEEKHMDAIGVLKTAADAGMHYGGGATAGYSPLDFDHTIPDWDSLLSLGFRGILERARENHGRLSEKGLLTEKKEALFRGIEIEYEGVLRFIARLRDYAAGLAHDKAQKTAQCLDRLYKGAPVTTYDALQLIYIYFMISESIDHYQVRSLGFGLDVNLYPFYRADIESGRASREEIEEKLSYFLMQWSAIGNYWGQPFYLGGVYANGETRVNELSYLILDVYDRLGIYNPKIQILSGDETPRDFITQALEMIRGGNSSIVFMSEDHMIRAIMARGGTYEDGCDAMVSGCYEYSKKNGSLDVSSVYPNIVKPVSLVFDNGVDRWSGSRIGPETGDPETFTSFGQFWDAYREQLRFQMDKIMDAVKDCEASSGEINPSLLYSATVPRCSESMTDALDGGIENDRAIVLGGLGSAVDSLMAVYEMVYEKKITDMATLKAALAADWEGYEGLRRIALNLKHKYGNGDRIADYYAKALYTYIGGDLIAHLRTANGGHVIIDGHSARAFIILGEKTWATPDGRKTGDEISKNISPVQGMDKNGVTALIRSAASIDTNLMTKGGCLDVMLHPSAVAGREGLEAFRAIIKTYFAAGGVSIHFNIFDPAVLRDAQKHPEKYGGLQIRVCGWNILWNDMPKKEQDMYILRAENIQ